MRAPSTLRRCVAVLLTATLGAVAAGCTRSDDQATPGTTAPPATVPGTSTTEAPLDAGKQIFVYTPEVGDCFDRRTISAQGGGHNDVVLKLDCGLPHQFEVYAVLQYPVDPVKLADPNTKTWPGDETVRKWAKSECPGHFKEYVGTDYELSRLETSFQAPTESTWLTSRTVTCLLKEPGDKRLAGSKRGSKE